MDFVGSDGSLSNLESPEITPGDEDEQGRVGAGRSPFSPPMEGGMSPFDVNSPESHGGYSPLVTELTSPASPARSPTSPTYSPVMADETSSPAYQPMSPTYSAQRSPAYTPSSSSAGRDTKVSTSKVTSSPTYQPRGSHDSHHSSSSVRELKRRSSPTWSPTYSPSTGSAAKRYGEGGTSPLTSPAYTPMSPQYTPTSPVYTPTSPQYSTMPRDRAPAPASPPMSPARHRGTDRTDRTTADMTSSPLADEDFGAGGSPRIQMDDEYSPGVELITSPSYTPHQGGDEEAGEPRSAPIGSDGLQDVTPRDEDAMSEHFEPSDDELDEMA